MNPNLCFAKPFENPIGRAKKGAEKTRLGASAELNRLSAGKGR